MPTYGDLAHPDDYYEIVRRLKQAEKLNTKLMGWRRPTLWITPTLLGAWVFSAAPAHQLQYRLGGERGLEFRGSVKDGASGSDAFAILMGFLPIDHNSSWLLDVGDVGSFVVGRAELDYTTGLMTITFPAS